MIIEFSHHTLKVLLFTYCFIALFNIGLSQKNFDEDLFKKYAVTGSTTLYDIDKNKWFSTGNSDSLERTLPASTFKILNTLILLQEGVISDVNDVVKWPGNPDTLKYGYRPDIYRDMAIKTAFEKSAVWVYVEMSKNIPNSKYRSYFKKIGYGNNYLLDHEIDFWNFGEFSVSPSEQIGLLIKLYRNDLPFKKKYQKMVKQIMFTSSNEYGKIYGKTGWTSYNNIRIGWWVGYVERDEKGPIFFVTRLMKPKSLETGNFGAARKEITNEVLSNYLNQN